MFCVSPGGTAPPLYVNTRSSLMSDWSTAESIYMATRRPPVVIGRPLRTTAQGIHEFGPGTGGSTVAAQQQGDEGDLQRRRGSGPRAGVAPRGERGDKRGRRRRVGGARRRHHREPAAVVEHGSARGAARAGDDVRAHQADVERAERRARVNPQVRHGGDARRLEHPRAGRAARAVERPAQRGARALRRGRSL